MQPAHEPLAEPMDLEDARFTLHDPREIARVLQALVDNRALISAFIMPGALPCPTALLEVRADGRVLIDGSQQDTLNRRIAEAHHLNCISQLDRVRIQFRLAGMVPVEVDGRPAFSVPAPESLLQLQRRELFRLPLIPGPVVTLQVPADDAGGAPLQVRVADISGGGLALSVRDEDEARFQPRAELAGCVLQLPDCEPIPVQLQVAWSARREPLAGAALRVGCRFLGLSGAAEKQILRYIFQVERQRNARERRAV